MTNRISSDAVLVSPWRLQWGTWCHTANCQQDQGDINASYSADLIAMENRIRKPFRLKGWLCVTVAIMNQPEEHAEAYRLVELSVFDGTPTTYGNRNHEDARQSSQGFYHGMTVKHGKHTYVLVGPPIVICGSGEPEPVQGSLF